MPMRQLFTLIMFPVLLGLSVSLPLSAAQLRIGILDWRATENFQRYWLPTLAGLQQALPEHALALYPMQPAELEQALAEQRVDFVVTNPGHYVSLSSRYGLAPLATLESYLGPWPLHQVASVLLVAADSDIETLTQLRGRHLAAVSEDAFGGFQIMADELQQQGFDPRRELGGLTFTGFPMDQLLTRLLNGEFDAVVVRSCLLELHARMTADPELAQRFRILSERDDGYPCAHSSRIYPAWPFLTTAHTDPALARRVAQVLLSSPAVVTDSGYSQWQVPVSYQSVYQLFERLRVGPFAAFPRNPVAAWLHQNRLWIVSGSMLVLLLLGHYLHSRYLIRRRSLQLLQAQTSIRQRDAELAHLSRRQQMGELTAALAHELNQPLTAINNYARASVNYLHKDDTALLQARPRLQQAAELISAQAEQAGATISRLRRLLRREPVHPQQILLLQPVEEALELAAAFLQQANVSVRLEPEGLAVQVYVDRTALLQVLLNLLRNAVDAMDAQSDGPHEIRIKAGVGRNAQRCVLELQDNGSGLDESVRDRLFEPFVTTKADGMGLGLALSQRLLEAADAELEIESQPGQGVCARIILPLATESNRTINKDPQ